MTNKPPTTTSVPLEQLLLALESLGINVTCETPIVSFVSVTDITQAADKKDKGNTPVSVSPGPVLVNPTSANNGSSHSARISKYLLNIQYISQQSVIDSPWVANPVTPVAPTPGDDEGKANRKDGKEGKDPAVADIPSGFPCQFCNQYNIISHASSDPWYVVTASRNVGVF